MRTDIIKLGTVLHTHRAPAGREKETERERGLICINMTTAKIIIAIISPNTVIAIIDCD